MLNRLPGGVGDSVRAVSSALDGRNNPSVLDIGAGAGDFARRLLRERRATVLVADLRPEVLAITRRNLANTNGVKFLRADVRALPLSDAPWTWRMPRSCSITWIRATRSSPCARCDALPATRWWSTISVVGGLPS